MLPGLGLRLKFRLSSAFYDFYDTSIYEVIVSGSYTKIGDGIHSSLLIPKAAADANAVAKGRPQIFLGFSTLPLPHFHILDQSVALNSLN